jgi:cytosine permease
VQFLVILGLIVPPVAAVYLTDYGVFRRHDYTDSLAPERDSTNVNGVLACLCGAIVGLMTYFRHTSLTGIPTIESFVSAGLFYAAAEGLRARRGLDRGWRMQGR